MKTKFIVGGAFASGTSFLASYLFKSKRINLIKTKNGKEINFFHFSKNYKKGLNWYSKFIKKKKINIDHSSLILTSEQAARRIFRYNKEMKFIFCLRNPVDRSYAHYRYTLLNGLEDKSFLQAIRLEKKRKQKLSGKWKEISPYSYIDKGMYYKHLLKFFKLFPKKNILLIKSEDLRISPYKILKKIFNFINLKFEKFKLPSNYSSGNIVNVKKHLELKKKIGKKFNVIIEKFRKNPNLLTKNNHDYKNLKENVTENYQEISIESRNYIKKFFKEDLGQLKKITHINF